MDLFKMELIQHTIVSFLLWVCFSVQAQAPLVLRYAEQMQHIDPNVVGSYSHSQLGLYFVSQWLGVDESPNEKGLFFNTLSTQKKLKWGATLRHRSRFAENNTALMIQFSYPIFLSQDTKLLLGLQGETDFYRMDFSSLRSVDGVSGDLLLERQSYFQPNVGVGLNVLHNTWHLRLALPHLFYQKNSAFVSDIRLTTNPFYFFEIGKTIHSLNLKTIKLDVQLHNLIWNSPTFQLQINYGWRFLAGTMTINHRKMVGLGIKCHFFYKSNIFFRL